MLYPIHCRKVAHKEVDFELSVDNLARELPRHSYYRGSDYLLLSRGDCWAVLALDKTSDRPQEELFHRLTGYRLLAGPRDCIYVQDPGVDVLNPTALALKGVSVLSRSQGEGGARCAPAGLPQGAGKKGGPEVRTTPTTVIVQGEFEHLSFIHEPVLLTIDLHDLTPPRPPKLLTQARQVLAYHDLGCPVRLEPHLQDLLEMADRAPTPEVVLPCFGGPEGAGRLHYLDRLPAGLPERKATLIGCHRSRDIYTQHYGRGPDTFHNLCPADEPALRAAEDGPPSGQGLHLAKCCQIGTGFRARGNVVYVGWGSTLADVERALRYLIARAVEAGLAPRNEAAEAGPLTAAPGAAGGSGSRAWTAGPRSGR